MNNVLAANGKTVLYLKTNKKQQLFICMQFSKDWLKMGGKWLKTKRKMKVTTYTE